MFLVVLLTNLLLLPPFGLVPRSCATNSIIFDERQHLAFPSKRIPPQQSLVLLLRSRSHVGDSMVASDRIATCWAHIMLPPLLHRVALASQERLAAQPANIELFALVLGLGLSKPTSLAHYTRGPARRSRMAINLLILRLIHHSKQLALPADQDKRASRC